MSPNQPLLPGSTLGVLGGGQLGRMFVHQAQAMGYFTAVLDADPTSPAGLVSHHHIQTGYEDPQGLAELARLSDAVTTEFENVPAAALATLAAQRPVKGCPMHAQQLGRFSRRAASAQQLAGMIDLAGGEGRAAAELHASRLGRLAAVPGAVDD